MEDEFFSFVRVQYSTEKCLGEHKNDSGQQRARDNISHIEQNTIFISLGFFSSLKAATCLTTYQNYVFSVSLFHTSVSYPARRSAARKILKCKASDRNINLETSILFFCNSTCIKHLQIFPNMKMIVR